MSQADHCYAIVALVPSVFNVTNSTALRILTNHTSLTHLVLGSSEQIHPVFVINVPKGQTHNPGHSFPNLVVTRKGRNSQL